MIGRLASLVGIALLVMAANVVISILYMVLYGHLIDPGHEPQYYREHVKVAAPYCSIVAGIPLMLLAGRWVAGFWDAAWGVKGALVVWLAYAMVDVVVTVASGMTARMALLVAVSLLTKLAAVCLGAWLPVRGG